MIRYQIIYIPFYLQIFPNWSDYSRIINLIIGTNIQQDVWFLNIAIAVIGSEHSFHVP